MRRRLPPTLVLGAAIVTLIILAALLSLVWTPSDPNHVEVGVRLRGPGAGYLLGTDQLGRDELSRLMAGARNTLLVGIITVLIAIGLGVPLGGLAALYRGTAEDATMRLADLLLAFPAILLALMFAAVFGPSTVSAMSASCRRFVRWMANCAAQGAALLSNREPMSFSQASYPSEVRWLKLDPEKVETKGNWVEKPDLSKVDEIGFADLMPGSGHGAGGWADVGKIEVYAKPVKR